MARNHEIETDEISKDTTIFDLTGTLRRLGGDTTLLADLAQLYDEDSPSLLARMASGIQAHRGAEVCRAAHTLRGLAANFGSSALTQPLSQLEEAVAQGDLEEANHLLEHVQTQSALLQATLAPHRR